jgi:hypothetical protein
MWQYGLWPAVALACAFTSFLADAAEGVDEFKVKRQETFEFTRAPEITRSGDRLTIRFAVKAFCDVTVAVEDANGTIVRHIACGVLGSNAPEPFQKDSLEQTIAWDGKDDDGKYLEPLESHTVRVSLGLKSSFERSLFREPRKRHGRDPLFLQVQPEGVYVYDGGNSRDFVRLFDHEGGYVRTVYPFPANQIERVSGLNRMTYPQDGLTLPVKPTFLQNTLLTCGNNFGYAALEKKNPKDVQALENYHYGMYGKAASFMAVRSGRIVLGQQFLNRFATDGSSGGLNFEGPYCALETQGRQVATQGKTLYVPPRSGAFSPDGKTLYLTGYNFCHYGKAAGDIVTSGMWSAFNCVMKMDVAGEAAPTLFAGSSEVDKCGKDEKSFTIPISVDTDAKGRVYVADYMNNRVQVFDDSGKLLRSLKVERPARVFVAPNTQELYVFSWLIYNIFLFKDPETITGRLTCFSNLDDPKVSNKWTLPDEYGSPPTAMRYYSGCGVVCDGVVDTYTTPPTVWLVREWTRENDMTRGKIKYDGIKLYALEKNGLKEKRDFQADTAKSVTRTRAPQHGRQRLNVNPKNGKVYVAEGDAFVGKAFKELIELDPNTGNHRLVPIPFDAEDMCFGPDGLAYLRTISVVARFDPETWREVPWDYGSDFAKLHTSSSNDRKETAILSGLLLPSDGIWHHGGMSVSLKGSLAIVCGYYTRQKDEGHAGADVNAKEYRAKLYPGREVGGRAGTTFIHIFDKRGQVVYDDAVPGLRDLYGIGMDKADNLYFLTASTRMIDGKRYHNPWTGTIMKGIPGKTRVLTVNDDKDMPVPLAGDQIPKGPPDFGTGGKAWVENKQWFYGGVGFTGKNTGIGCACHNTRFTLDYFNRSFAPEVDRYRVAVLDSNGNLILRIGQYGNEDSEGPGSKVPLGGDEVGLFHGAYVATHTDRRLFIADEGNGRIVSVKLDYHASEKVKVPGEAASKN